MPEQTARGLRYPTISEAPAFADDFERLAADIDTLLPRVVTGSVWVTPRPNQPTTHRVTFPDGLFAAGDRPHVLVGANTSVPGSRVELASYSNLTPSAVDLVVRRSDNVRTILMYAAIQNGGGASATGWQRPQYDGRDNTTARPSRYLDSLQAAVLAGMVRVETGQITFTPTAGTPTSARVSFSEGVFSRAPVVLTTTESAWPYSRVRGSGASSISATGCDINVTRTDSFPTNVDWVAIQPTASGRLWSPGGPANLPDLLEEFATNVERRIPRIDSGVVPITPRPNEPTAVRVEFTPGRFTRVPRIIVTANTSARAVRGVTFSNPTATGADVWINRTDSTETWLRWFAIEE